jgi:hypothetical protein
MAIMLVWWCEETAAGQHIADNASDDHEYHGLPLDCCYVQTVYRTFRKSMVAHMGCISMVAARQSLATMCTYSH